MIVILLEALLALGLLVGIVWWTMFSGRPKGELPKDANEATGTGDETLTHTETTKKHE